jgi:tRNA(Ile)-lysidine synthase
MPAGRSCINCMELLDQFKQHWKTQFPQLPVANGRLLLAVSGGIDSVVLVDLLAAAGFPFAIAHANFQLRGEESERDELFVRKLATDYQSEIFVQRFDTHGFAAEQKLSIQEAARELRYTWFAEIIARWKDEHINGYVLTAHHADDNIETMLMHFFRGTGIEGLAGMLAWRKEQSLLRPLLPFRKQALVHYAKERNLAFVEDSSNASDKYTRNFFRNSLLPQIAEVFPKAEENLLHNIERFSEVTALYHEAAAVQLKKLLEPRGKEWHIPVLKWKKASPLSTISWELVKPFGFSAAQVPEIIKLLDADNGSYIASTSHRLIRNRNWMIISPLASGEAAHIIIEKEDTLVQYEQGGLQLKSINGPVQPGQETAEAFLDTKDIRFPLILRRWKQGDYFYPLGMAKKKKISRFLIDLKLSLTAKEKVWVLESDQRIIWVIGYRIDNRFRITDKTVSVLHCISNPL